MNETRKLLGCQVFDKGNTPPGWEIEALGERIELAYGRALPEERRRSGSVTVYGSNGPVGTHDDFFLKAPGLLVGRKGTVGAVHFSENDYWPIDTVYYVRTLKGDDLRYLYYLLQYLPLEQLNAATGVPGLSRRDAYALNGVFANVDEQKTIASILHRLDQHIATVCAGVANPRSLRVPIFTDEFQSAAKSGSPEDFDTSYAAALIDLKMSLIDAIFTGRITASSIAIASETALL